MCAWPAAVFKVRIKGPGNMAKNNSDHLNKYIYKKNNTYGFK